MKSDTLDEKKPQEVRVLVKRSGDSWLLRAFAVANYSVENKFRTVAIRDFLLRIKKAIDDNDTSILTDRTRGVGDDKIGHALYWIEHKGVDIWFYAAIE